MKKIADLNVKMFADGADMDGIMEMYEKPYIHGFTTNPTLMRKAGVSNYESFARSLLAKVSDRPISFEVFADDFDEMERQARLISAWGDNVYVKIPVTNTRREPSDALVRRLSRDGVKLNVTAMMTPAQVQSIVAALEGGAPAYASVFAGRIADSGRDPVPLMRECLEIVGSASNIELLWASCRELLNVFQADAIGCHVITVTNDILAKLALVGKDLDEFSLDTVKMFHGDGEKAGFKL